MPTQERDVIELLRRVSACDAENNFYWNDSWPEYKPIAFFINCNDFFAYAADSEEVTMENLPILEQAMKDCPVYGHLVFVARVRKQLPLPRSLERLRPEVRTLFEAAVDL